MVGARVGRAPQYQSEYFGTFNEVISGSHFYGIFFLTLGLTMVPSYLEFFFKDWFRPTPIVLVREQASLKKLANRMPEQYPECARSADTVKHSAYVPGGWQVVGRVGVWPEGPRLASAGTILARRTMPGGACFRWCPTSCACGGWPTSTRAAKRPASMSWTPMAHRP
jgi:hypothetical protein